MHAMHTFPLRFFPRAVSRRLLLARTFAAATVAASAFSLNLAAAPANPDECLAKILIDKEDWQLVAEGFGFTDAACADADGNFYFMDLGKGTGISKVSPDGKVSEFLANTPKCSGLKFGPDGRLYACTQGPKKQVVAIAMPSGEVKVLADNVQPNDLAVSRAGYVYFTETGKGQVTIVDPQGQVRVGATGINAPNGITLSPDQQTLAVSEYRGTNVWTYRVGADGNLSDGARRMTLRTPLNKPDSGGDGSTVDATGRYYVTSHLGIQIFGPDGQLCGVMAKPTTKGCVSVAFAGAKQSWLYACAADKVFRRQTKAAGASAK